MSNFDMQGFSKITWTPLNPEAATCRHELIIRGVSGRLVYGWCKKCHCGLEKLLDFDPVLVEAKS